MQINPTNKDHLTGPVNSGPADSDERAVRKGAGLKSGWLIVWLEGLLTFLIFFIMGADPAPHRNEAHYLCRLKHFWDPEWCQGDLFLDSPDAHFTVVWLFGWLTLICSLETVAWIGRILSWGVLAWAWQRLHRRITPLAWLAPLTAAIFVVGTEQTHLAGEWLIGGFEAKTLAYAFVFFAMCDVIDGRWNRSWILLGVASAMHALVGAWSVLAMLFAWALLREKPSIKTMLPGLLIGGALSFMGVWPALALNIGTPAEVSSEANQIYVFTRLPHHLSLLTMRWEWLSNRLFRHSIIIALLVVTRFLICRDKRLMPDCLKGVRLFAWGSLVISASGMAIELIGWNHPAWAASLLRYYWWRLADIAVPLAVALSFAWLIAKAFERKSFIAPLALVGCLGLSVWGACGYAMNRIDHTVAPAEARLYDVEAWDEMCEWISQNTAKEALFLVPRSSLSFKWRAGRAEVVTYKDIPQDANSMVEWNRRCHDVFLQEILEDGSKRWYSSVAQIGSTRLKQLAEEYGASYALSQNRLNRMGYPIGAGISLPIVHRVGPYTLYDLRSQDDTEAK